MSERNGGEKQGWVRRAAFGSIGAGAVVAVALIMLVGSAAAAPVTAAKATTVDKAPYAGEGSGSLDIFTQGCGYTGTAPVLPSVDNLTGQGVASVKVSAPSCGSSNSSDVALAELSVWSGVLSGLSGTHNVSAHFSLSYVLHLAAKAGGATQSAESIGEVYVTLWMFDVTKNTYSYSNAVGVFQLITSGTYSHTYTNQKLVPYFDFSFKSSHSYEWEADVELQLYALSSPGSSTASSSINMGTGSEHSELTEVSY